ncbi:hypothetical protein [Dactylosporangium cerinum]
MERPRKRWLPYLLLLPGGLWLILFFAVPAIQLFATSLYDPSGSLEEGYAMTWQFSNYADAASEYLPHFMRSLGYAALTTVICLLLGYPSPTRSRSRAAGGRTCCSSASSRRSSPAS